MADFKKLLEHPEKQNIISKLVSGDSPKIVSAYLKDKYSNPNESHLRLTAILLQEFLDTYGNHHGYAKKIINKDCDNKLDKKIAESLLNNKDWKQRLEESTNKEIDFKQKWVNLITILEARAEQLFDLIQSNPEGTKTDYVFTKYLELIQMAIEKGDKVFNNRPDIRIEHTYTVQMVEQQSVAFQEAIRKVLERLGPELTYTFMDMLNEELNKINPKNMDSYQQILPQTANKSKAKMDKDIKMLDGAFEDIKDIDNQLEGKDV